MVSGKGTTSIFGTNAEQYISSLLNFKKIPSGSNLPDFRGDDNSYISNLIVELKSGKRGKGSMVFDQLFHGLVLADNFDRVLDSFSLSKKESLLNHFSFSDPFYYSCLARDDNVKGKDLARPYSCGDFSWG